jgi:polysaccharide pyruvyl transferase WcaK-like protein
MAQTTYGRIARSTVLIRRLNYIPLVNSRIGYIGWTGHGNLGDETMYKAIRMAFNQYDFLLYRYHAKMQSLEKILKKRVYRSVMLGGGTLINCPVENWLDRISQAQKLNYPTFVFGTGVRNPEFWDRIPGASNILNEWIPLLEQCRFVGVRGPVSKGILEQNGFHKAEVIGDPALFFARPKIKTKTMNKKLGLNIGMPKESIWGKQEEVLDNIVNFARIMIDKGWEITFVPVLYQDLPYIEEAVRRINKHNKIFLNYKSLKDTLDLIESCDIFIGEKLHSVVLACCVYTPSIMLEYQPKCNDFMASLDLQNYNMRTDHLDNERLVALCYELYEKSSIIQEYVYKRVNAYKKKIHDCAVKLQKDIGV